MYIISHGCMGMEHCVSTCIGLPTPSPIIITKHGRRELEFRSRVPSIIKHMYLGIIWSGPGGGREEGVDRGNSLCSGSVHFAVTPVLMLCG